jgi:hypothetical protein
MRCLRQSGADRPQAVSGLHWLLAATGFPIGLFAEEALRKTGLLDHRVECALRYVVMRAVPGYINKANLSGNYAAIAPMTCGTLPMQCKSLRFNDRNKFRECAS